MLILKAPSLAGAAIEHGFFGRPGGASTGLYAGLNCGPGSGDNRDAVIENRRRAMTAIGTQDLVTCYQVHSATCVTVTTPWPIDAAPHADAMVSNVRGIALGILTADCGPVLFADAEAGVIGAAHAGWKGAIGGVTDSVVAAMEALGAKRERIAAAIGPCIAQTSYEVDAAFRTRFVTTHADNAAFFIASNRDDYFRFDLEAYIAHRLKAAGVHAITALHADTYPDPDMFFSYRRATHRGESDYGRDLSAIVLK